MVKVQVPEGEMSAVEIRKLIRTHNKLSQIKIPKGTDRLGLIQLIKDKNYTINHKLKRIEPKQQRGKTITLNKTNKVGQSAEEVLPKPKTKEEKAAKRAEAAKKKEDKLKAETDKTNKFVKTAREAGIAEGKKTKNLELVKGGAALARLAAARKARKVGKKPDMVSMGTQTSSSDAPKMTDKQLLAAYGYMKVGEINKILDTLKDTSSAGGGTKLDKLKKVIKFGGLSKLKAKA